MAELQTPTEIAAAVDSSPAKVSASISVPYRRAQGSWAHVVRERVSRKGPVEYRYRYDVATMRTPSMAEEDFFGGHESDEVFAKVLHDDGTDVILLESTGSVIKGRRLR